MRLRYALLVTVLPIVSFCQNPSSVKSTTAGPCSPAVGGNHNTFNIHCSIDPVKGKQIVRLLNKVLANQMDTAQVMSKLDELLSRPNGIQQSTTGPNSPNIVGSGNSITYSDTSSLPILSERQMETIKLQLSQVHGKLDIRFSASDSDAQLFANDLLTTLKSTGWDVKWHAELGGGNIGNSVPLVMGASDPNVPGGADLQRVLSAVLGLQIPGVIEPSIPQGEIGLQVISHPITRPQ